MCHEYKVTAAVPWFKTVKIKEPVSIKIIVKKSDKIKSPTHPVPKSTKDKV